MEQSLSPTSPLPVLGSLLTIITFRHYHVPIGLVFSIHDSTEVSIKKMIETSQRMLRIKVLCIGVQSNRHGYISSSGYVKDEEDVYFHWRQLESTKETQLLWNYQL